MSLLFKLILDWSAEKSDKAIGYFPRISDIFFVHSLLRCCERYFLKCSCSAILGRGVQCDGREELIRSQCTMWLSFSKNGIRDSNQISTTAPIFLQFNYFRQNLEKNVTFTFYFLSFASNFPCKIL